MCHVLIIEDEPLVAMDIQNVLVQEGATSFAFASTQADAVEQACARRPLIITSDVRLSAGTGPAAVRLIRERLGKIPVMFVSATPAECRPREAADLVFSKPFDRADIAREFRRMLAVLRGSRMGGTPLAILAR